MKENNKHKKYIARVCISFTSFFSTRKRSFGVSLTDRVAIAADEERNASVERPVPEDSNRVDGQRSVHPVEDRPLLDLREAELHRRGVPVEDHLSDPLVERRKCRVLVDLTADNLDRSKPLPQLLWRRWQWALFCTVSKLQPMPQVTHKRLEIGNG